MKDLAKFTFGVVVGVGVVCTVIVAIVTVTACYIEPPIKRY